MVLLFEKETKPINKSDYEELDSPVFIPFDWAIFTHQLTPFIMLTKTKKGPSKLLTLLLGALILCVPALLNRFPFIYSDTGTYLLVGFGDGISYIRTLMYGVFLRHISMKESFWFVVLAQALIVSWYIQLFARVFFPSRDSFFEVGIVALLTLTTSIGICTGMLMPDFTTPLLFLGSGLFLFGNSLSKPIQALNVVFIWFFLTVHHSHALILLPAMLGFFFLSLFFRKDPDWKPNRKIAWLTLLIAIGYISIPTAHYLKNGEFISSKSQNVFLMSRFHQMGLLTPFLEQECEQKNYTICAYKDNIPTSFLWDRESPLLKDGGWLANNENYRPVVKDFFATPTYLKRFVIKSFETAAQQFVTFNTVAMNAQSPGEWPQTTFELYMPHTVMELENAKQDKGTWRNDRIDLAQNVLVFSCAVFMIWLFGYQTRYEIEPLHRKLAVLLLFFLLANAFICGGISMIAPRFQSRVIWLVPFFTLALISHGKLFYRNRLG